MMKILLCAAALAAVTSPLVHPFGPVRRQRSSSLLAGVKPDDPRALRLLERACQNCHSQRTQWPSYSYLPLASWALEKDVADARQHLDLSNWERYSAEQQRDLLARIGTEVRNRQMPLPRYLVLHPEARLSAEEIQIIYHWTVTQRHSLRQRE